MKLTKKILYTANVAYWFVGYNLVHGHFYKVWHLFKCLFGHVVRNTPYAAIIETSNTCNFHCPTCPTPHKLIHARRPPQLMELSRFKKIIDNIKNQVHIVYLYNSNEPLLHPEIIDMIKYVSACGLHAMISTNCSLLTPDMTEKLLKSGLGEIRFAFDGLDKQTFENFRVGGDFETVKKNLEYFCKRKAELGVTRPITTLQFILNKLNQDQISLIKKFSRENNIDKLYVKPFILSGYAYPAEEIANLSDRFLADIDIDDELIVYKKAATGLKPKTDYQTCPDAQRIFTILADGRAVMCCFDLFGDYSYGQMDEQPLSQLWFSDKAKQLRAQAGKRQLPLCKICGNIE